MPKKTETLYEISPELEQLAYFLTLTIWNLDKSIDKGNCYTQVLTILCRFEGGDLKIRDAKHFAKFIRSGVSKPGLN